MLPRSSFRQTVKTINDKKKKPKKKKLVQYLCER